MKNYRTIVKQLAIVAGIALSTVANADHLDEWASGKLTTISLEPNQSVNFQLNVSSNTSCGSNYFNLPDSNPSKREIYAMLLTAFSLDQAINVHIDHCNGDTGNATHAYMSN